MHPPGATNTSRTASCWPWSTSPSRIRSTTAPVLSQLIPTWSRTVGSSQLTNLGETTPAFDRNDSSTIWCTASWSSADVVVEEQVEGGTLDHAQDLVRGGAVGGTARQVADERVGEQAGDPLGDLGRVLTGGEDQDRELVVVLGGEGGEGLFEPWARLGGHHDGDHGGHLGVHQVPEAIRSARRPSGTEFVPEGCLIRA